MSDLESCDEFSIISSCNSDMEPEISQFRTKEKENVGEKLAVSQTYFEQTENTIKLLQEKMSELSLNNDSLSDINQIKSFLHDVRNIVSNIDYENIAEDKSLSDQTLNSASSRMNGSHKHHINSDVTYSHGYDYELELPTSSKCTCRAQLDELVEENACLKSRIGVLELELRSKNEENIKSDKNFIDHSTKEKLVLKDNILENIHDSCTGADSLRPHYEGLILQNTITTTRLLEEFTKKHMEAMRNLASFKDSLYSALSENVILHEELAKLKKESIGRATICDFLSEDNYHPMAFASCDSDTTTASKKEYIHRKKRVRCYVCRRWGHVSWDCKVLNKQIRSDVCGYGSWNCDSDQWNSEDDLEEEEDDSTNEFRSVEREGVSCDPRELKNDQNPGDNKEEGNSSDEVKKEELNNESRSVVRKPTPWDCSKYNWLTPEDEEDYGKLEGEFNDEYRINSKQAIERFQSLYWASE